MFSKTIEVYIGYVRKKLSPDVILTVKWMWYKFWY
jgi:DNA-binding response OmpR family regulator